MSTPKPLLIGGEWIADSSEAISSVNPANGEVNYEVSAATACHVDAAVEAAHQAAASAAWRNLLLFRRARANASPLR